MRFIFFIVFILFQAKTFSQTDEKLEHQVDSIQKLYSKAKNDTVKVNLLMAWDNLIFRYDPALDLKLNKEIDSICRLNLKKDLSKKDQEYFIAKLAFSLNNQGIICKSEGNFAQAIDYYMESLKLWEQIRQQKGIASTLGNIGLIYKNQNDHHHAIEYYKKALVIFKEMKDDVGISGTYNNLGMSYEVLKKLDTALYYYRLSFDLTQKSGNKRGLSVLYENIGNVKFEQGDLDSSMLCFQEALLIQKEINDRKGMVISINSIAKVYYGRKEYKKAISYSKEAFNLAEELGVIMEQVNAMNIAYLCYKELGDAKNALLSYELYHQYKQKFETEENKKEVIRQEYKYKYDQQSAKDSVKNAEAQKVKDAKIELQEAENLQQRQRNYFLIGGLILTIILGGFVFNRFRITNKQNRIIKLQKKEVEHQKEIVEEKNDEILASINYAKRIQNAILPPQKLIDEHLGENFVLYKPKDIVAGDFYWLEHKNGWVYFAAADCTGHGVPGAMVSVICNNGLNRSVREHGITEPGLILDKTREIVIAEFEKSDEDVKDGMDISLCALSRSQLQLKWAGANNPLWIIRGGELIEYKPNKQPIGKYGDSELFLTHKIDLQKGDSIYVFTDGYQDQFGGEKGKKYRAAKMKEALISIQNLTMIEQKEFLDKEFYRWKGKLEQIDDVCVIGVKI